MAGKGNSFTLPTDPVEKARLNSEMKEWIAKNPDFLSRFPQAPSTKPYTMAQKNELIQLIREAHADLKQKIECVKCAEMGARGQIQKLRTEMAAARTIYDDAMLTLTRDYGGWSGGNHGKTTAKRIQRKQKKRQTKKNRT